MRNRLFGAGPHSHDSEPGPRGKNSRARAFSWRVFLVFALLALPLGSPPAAAAPAGQASSTLTIDLTAEAESLDPAFVNQVSGESIMKSIFDNLIERDYNGQLTPMLAETWTVVDPTTIEFKLRQGVVFHNGEPFTSDSVKFSIFRLKSEELNSPAASQVKNIRDVVAIDDYTVRFLLSSPDATIFDALTQNASMLPPGYYIANDASTVASAPVGTGPYKFDNWLRDDHLTLVANNNYWGDFTYKGPPVVQQVTFRPVPQAATRVSDLLSGSADIILDVPPDELDTLRSQGMNVVTADTARYQFVFFRPNGPTHPLANQKVRQALNYGTNVEAIVQNLLRGLGTRQPSPIGAGVLGYDPAVQPYPYDPARARQLLAEAGFPNGLTLTMDMSSSDRPDVALAVAGQLRDIGVTVQPRTIELAQFNNNWVQKKTGDLLVARWGAMNDPAVFLNFLATCNGLLNAVCVPAADTLVKQGAQVLDLDARAGAYAQLSAVLRDDPIAIYLSNAVGLYGVSPRVTGWRGPTGRDLVVPTNLRIE